MPYLIEGEHYPVVFLEHPSNTLVDRDIIAGLADPLSYNGEPLEDALTVKVIMDHREFLVNYFVVHIDDSYFEVFVEDVLQGRYAELPTHRLFPQDANYILRHNILQFELDTLCTTAGLPKIVLPKYKPHHKNDNKPKWLNWFSTRLNDKVCRHYYEEMEMLGYGSLQPK